MSRARRPRRFFTGWVLGRLVLALLLLCAVGAALVATGRLVLPYRFDPFAPLVFAAEPNWLDGLRLARIKRNVGYCERSLDASRIVHQRLPDRDTPVDCPLTEAVSLPPAATRFGERVAATCSVAASWLAFEERVVRPAAREHLRQEIVRVEQRGTYVCRRIAGSERWSQHASGNAIDIAGLVLADGSRVTLLGHWDGDDARARFLRAVRDGACRWFNGVLGPDYNAAHRDHFHLDQGPYRICR